MKQRLLRYSFAMALLLVAMNLQAVALESQIANATVTWYSDVAGEKAITSAAPGATVYIGIQPAEGYWTSAAA